MKRDGELEALRRLSASIGADPALTQAAGGNTSVKRDGVMWIKASGTWLLHACDRDIFVPIALDRLRHGMETDDPACETCLDYIDQSLNTNDLRPSVETTVHAGMPQRVVVHVHCVETISWAVRSDAEEFSITIQAKSANVLASGRFGKDGDLFGQLKAAKLGFGLANEG